MYGYNFVCRWQPRSISYMQRLNRSSIGCGESSTPTDAWTLINGGKLALGYRRLAESIAIKHQFP